MANTANYIDGTWGTALQGTTPLCINKWDATYSAKVNETPVSCNPGYMGRSSGMKDATGNFTVFYDGVTLPTFDAGQVIQKLRLGNQYTTPGTTVVQFAADAIVVDNVKVTNTPGSPVTYDIAWSLQSGKYYLGDIPTQSGS